MKYVSISLVIAMIATLVITVLSKPEGESWGRGWNLIFIFVISSAWIWAHVLILAGWFAVRGYRDGQIAERFRTYRWRTAITLVGLVMPIITGLLIRLKAA